MLVPNDPAARAYNVEAERLGLPLNDVPPAPPLFVAGPKIRRTPKAPKAPKPPKAPKVGPDT